MVEVEFSGGIFRIISSMIGSSFSYVNHLSSSADNATTTACRNGVRFALSRFKCFSDLLLYHLFLVSNFGSCRIFTCEDSSVFYSLKQVEILTFLLSIS